MTIDDIYAIADFTLQSMTSAQRITFYKLTKAQQTAQVKALLQSMRNARQAEHDGVDAAAAVQKTNLLAQIADLDSGIALLP